MIPLHRFQPSLRFGMTSESAEGNALLLTADEILGIVLESPIENLECKPIPAQPDQSASRRTKSLALKNASRRFFGEKENIARPVVFDRDRHPLFPVRQFIPVLVDVADA
jgi:hypothetical protein